MRNLFRIIIILSLSFVFTNYARAQEKIAFVDVNYVFNNSSVGKKINSEIQKKSKKISSEFEKFKKETDADKEKLLKQKNVIAKEEYLEKLKELENNINKYNTNLSKKNQALAEYKSKARIEFTNNLAPILAKFSKANSISMIFRKENLLIGKNSLDVTNGVLDMFNKEIKSLSLN